MIGSIVVAHMGDGEVFVGRFELRGIYQPAYGFWIVGEHGERSVDWTELTSLLRVGSRVVATLECRNDGAMTVIPAGTRPPPQGEPVREPDGLAIST